MMQIKKQTMLVFLVLIAVIARILPHPPNFTPIAATALFSGAYFSRKSHAYAISLLAMLVGDLFIGFHQLMPVVYVSFALTVALGFWLKSRVRPSTVLLTAVTGSILFFLITNFGVWYFLNVYPHTWAGLMACYMGAIPYFQNSLASSLVYSVALFGGFAFMQSHIGLADEAEGLKVN